MLMLSRIKKQKLINQGMEEMIEFFNFVAASLNFSAIKT